MGATKTSLLDPRVERSRGVVLEATLDLLAEVGYGDLTIEAVAARSGVAKSTIYRHWPGKLALITEAFTNLRKFNEPPPPPGPVRDRVVALLQDAAEKSKDPEYRAACVPALIEAAARCPEVAEVSAMLAEKAAARLVAVLDDGVAAGELPAGADTSVLADALMGPIALRSFFQRPRLEPEAIPALVDLVLPLRN